MTNISLAAMCLCAKYTWDHAAMNEDVYLTGHLGSAIGLSDYCSKSTNYSSQTNNKDVDQVVNVMSINAQGQLTPAEQKALLQSAKFTEKDIRRIYRRFKALDTNNNGELDPHELFDVPEIADNPLVKRVISVFDTNGDGKVSFTEFMVGLAKLTTGTDEYQKTKFAFDIYDVTKDGYISNGELFTVMKTMVGNNLTDQQLQQLVDRTMLQADRDGDGLISFAEFQDVVAHVDIPDKLKIDV
ncbi:calcineurin B subunit [Gregarina niphandrodes]|uniref:Calcineurin B subunit n=1 Tax=Gregarina niphandrodes TaxID=110365 RepID=A0A023BAU5_GRENI|nr:calcineurin B subunit [Gregarina niphandrodes]EZG78637.1 calcineurin B subunit [Gregarina niphandrodes]|eukprot:XP_011129228.1 calcineurin B subunit [Gregarina niphandrodes]